VFLAIFQVLQCVFFIFHDFQFSRHIPRPIVCISHFPTFSVFLAIFQGIQCLCLIFHVFQCFLPYSRSYRVYLSFFHVFQGFMTYITSYRVCFSISMIFSFFAILQILQCAFLIFHVFKCFSPYSRSYRVCVSFSMLFLVFSLYSWFYRLCFSFFTFLCVFCHIPDQTICAFDFSRFSFSLHYLGATVCFSHFSSF
jgi:hypothetical protein